MRTNDRRFRWLALLAALLLSFGLASCGDDDEAATSEGTGSDSASEDSVDVEEYCDAVLAIETVPEPDIDFESLSENEQKEAAKKFANDELVDLAAKVSENTPGEIADAIEVLVGAVDDIAETGDFSIFETPEVEKASDEAHVFDLKNCGWDQADVTAVDYEFTGVAETLDAGAISFEFANQGKELHEFILLKKKDGVSESYDEILELPEEEGREKVDQVDAVFAMPGEDDYFVADLEAGDYIALCFIPVGLTPEAAEAAESGGEEPQGPPHFTQGMRTEFTVK